MEVEEIFKIIFGVTASIGTIGAFILFVIKLSAEKIAEALQKKYTLKFDKELEKYKTHLDNKTYISKTKFDAEFEIYRDLSADFCSAVRDISTMIPILGNVPVSLEERKKYDVEVYNKAVESVSKAQSTLYGNIPFISNELAERYSEILKLCNRQLSAFSRRWSASFMGSYEEKSNLEHEVYDRTNIINDKFKEIGSLVRDYLSTLDVIE